MSVYLRKDVSTTEQNSWALHNLLACITWERAARALTLVSKTDFILLVWVYLIKSLEYLLELTCFRDPQQIPVAQNNEATRVWPCKSVCRVWPQSITKKFAFDDKGDNELNW